MGRDDWYRNRAWTPEIEAAFGARLARSRNDRGRAQYLRIQAACLAESGDVRSTEAALALLDRMLAEYPDRIQLAQARLQRAKCLERLGRDDETIAAFREALRSERAFPNVKTDAWIAFGWFAIERGRSELYTEAIAILDEFARSTLFAFEVYRLHAIRAIVLDHSNDPAEARMQARAALDAAAARHSGLRYHPTWGLVRDTDAPIHRRLRMIADGHLDA
jgi:tetratricopeptide (TPR) repeat protein